MTIVVMSAETVNITTREVAEIARVAPSTVRRWVLSGLLRPAAVTPGGQYRFSPDVVETLLDPARAS